MNRVRVFDGALRELDDVVTYYETEREGLGLEFFEDHEVALQKAAQDPIAGMLVRAPKGRLRYRTLRVFFDRFPYTLIVVELKTERGVVAIAADKREPFYWAERLFKLRR